MKKLVAYITSGYPSIDFSSDLIYALKDSGVDTIELGIPFSDPVADGEIIQLANLKSLQNGFRMDELFELSNRVCKDIDSYWMGYFNSFYHKGFDFFVSKAKEAKLKGFIIPDLPYEETIEYLDKLNGIELISFVAPTDSQERIAKITKNSKGFIYLVAYSGITGASKESLNLNEIISYIRDSSKTPIYLGFGITRENAKEKAKNVDGVIVGSAFIKILLNDRLTNSEKLSRISTLSKEIKEEINS